MNLIKSFTLEPVCDKIDALYDKQLGDIMIEYIAQNPYKAIVLVSIGNLIFVNSLMIHLIMVAK